MEKSLAIQREVMEILGTDQVFLCGGAVRDLVMGGTAHDYDFTTSMLPEDMVEKVKAAGRRVYTIGEKFGTIGFKVGYAEAGTFLMKDGRKQKGVGIEFVYVEVTTFRSEVYTSKSRKPEVKFVPALDEDLARRDFTMNAMVLKSDGKIYDPYGGKLDIHGGKIKTVGMPKDRIQEDPLRMLRAARFAARYNFEIDPNFIGKARHLADRIYDVSIERWVQELDKLLTSSCPGVGIDALSKMGLLERILPDVNFREWKVARFENPNEAWKNVLIHTNANPRTARYMNAGICARLKFSNDRRDYILSK